MQRDDGHGRGLGLTTLDDWTLLAKHVVLDLINDELALPHAELEARLYEQGIHVPGAQRPVTFYPHVITAAVGELRELGTIIDQDHATKGNAKVTLFVPADQTNRTTAIERAVRRKGMLYARFLRLAKTAGPAGEQTVRTSLTRAGRHLVPVVDRPPFGPVRTLLNVGLYGELDSAFWLHTIDPVRQVPRMPLTVPLEVKNRRLVLYPIHKEVHQLLSKAAVIQLEQPDQPILPILVCRRAHPWLFWMAKDLGFLVHTTGRQFITPPKAKDMSPKHIEEVRDVLRLRDLTLVTDDETPTIRAFFERTIGKEGPDAASRWQLLAPTVAPYADRLRTEEPNSWERQELIRGLRGEVADVLSAAGVEGPANVEGPVRSWSLPEHEEIVETHGDDEVPF